MTKLTAFYAKLTPAQKARLWTLLLTGLQGIAAIGDKITPTPFLPGWLVNGWPMIVTVDLAALKLINIFTDPNAKPTTPAPSAPGQV